MLPSQEHTHARTHRNLLYIHLTEQNRTEKREREVTSSSLSPPRPTLPANFVHASAIYIELWLSHTLSLFIMILYL